MPDSLNNNNRSAECQICGSAAKYTCPGCQLRTCSVPCIKQHKEKTQCSGERQKIKYKPLTKMDDLDLLNDYRLLEGIGRDVDLLRRDTPRVRVNPATGAPLLRPAQYRLRRAARRRGVRLEFLPEGFQRRVQNTSRWQKREAADGWMVWRLEWRLPLADAVRVDEGVPDTERLGNVLQRHLDPAAAAGESTLQYYRAAQEARQLRVFLQAERVQHGNRYVEIPLTRALEACLRGQTVIEFPVLVVTTESHAHVYRDDVIQESFFSICKREEEDRRRAQRSERRHRQRVGDRSDDDDDGRPRKVPRPRLDAVPVADRRLPGRALPINDLNRTAERDRAPLKEEVEAGRGCAVSEPFFVEGAPVVKDLEVGVAEQGVGSSAGFGLFGADDGDDDELSD